MSKVKDYEQHLLRTIIKKKELLVQIYKTELVQNQIMSFKDTLKEVATHNKDSGDEVHCRKEIAKLQLILTELTRESKEYLILNQVSRERKEYLKLKEDQ